VKQPDYVGVGLYSFAEAARLIGVKPSTLHRWVSEYQGTEGEGLSRRKPVIVRYFEDGQRLLTFLELVELLFVKLFRREGVSMQVIRKAAAEATRRFDTVYPFAVKRFDTDGRRIFATLREASDGERVVEELGKGQLVFDTVVRPFFRRLDFCADREALRYWPMERDGRVVLDPQRAFGQPIDAETGVSTRALSDAVMAGGGQSPATVAEWFGVPIAAVEAAVEFETLLSAA
jgi:uncharacterized protein (DUF433 family)/transposase-like protein